MHVSDYANSAFHLGELQAQQQAGALEQMAAIGPRVIRDFMPQQHREFFAQLPFLVVGSQDGSGQPWASILVGAAGFIASPQERQLTVAALPQATDPLHANLRQGTALGLLGIAPHTRRRNRANGMVSVLREDGMVIDIQQSFGNCPKYIQARQAEWIDRGSQSALAIENTAALSTAMQALIASADTFFIATSLGSDANALTGAHGVDVSHRGGKPGFVRIDGDRHLTVPDFVGNSFFNTIGNLLVHPRAGLLFVDFDNGDLLYLAVTAEVIWRGPQVDGFAGAQRLLRLQVTQARLVRAVLPLRWSAPALSPFLQPMGSWG